MVQKYKERIYMSFLTKIDEMHAANLKKYAIETTNSDFNSYFNIEPIGISLSKSFILKKQVKAKLLLISGKQRVYLSDFRIISTILSVDKKYTDWFLNEFIKLYNNEYKNFAFKLENEKFDGVGIDYYPESYEITLFSDTVIDINDLIFVINFIFSKDKQWENDKSLKNFSKSTIVKYIALIDYYSNKSARSEEFLLKIGYPTDKQFFSNFSVPQDMFSNISFFDISKYM